jgi:DNA-directed RNA polymerase subunit RPC12/RpoP
MKTEYVDNKYINKYTQEEVSTFMPDAFNEIRKQFGLEPIQKRTNKQERLQKQRNQFLRKYVCRVCGNPMEWIKGTNVMACTNKDCKGIQKKERDEDGNEKITTLPVMMTLNPHGEEIAETLFN